MVRSGTLKLVKFFSVDSLAFVGWGETTLEGKTKSTCAAVDELADYFIGKDPLRIEHHWQHVYLSASFRGGNVLMSALSGIDQALWEMAGKHYDVSAYQLSGSAVRDRVRVYAHWGIESLTDEEKAAAKARLGFLQRKGGYTAISSWRGLKPRQQKRFNTESVSKPPVSDLRRKAAPASTSDPCLPSDCEVHRRICLVPMPNVRVST